MNLEKDVSISPWPDAQPCRSPAMAATRCVWHEASPAKRPSDSASLTLKKMEDVKYTRC